MKQEEIIQGFVQLGKLMRSLGEEMEWTDFSIGVTREEYEDLVVLINRQFSYNGWFIKENVRQSLLALGKELDEANLKSWLANYSYASEPKRVAIIMAGNIPLVGFHDFLATLCAGHCAVCKLSSNDKTLLPALATHLIEFVPELKNRIHFSEGRIGEIDAVIATGSDNSVKYFEQYFGKYPHIFRKNRTSLAIVDGTETKEELELLGTDIFSYFGLGCRNVSLVFIPSGFELRRIFEGIYGHHEVINNNKYGNNYDYNKAIYLMNQLEILDNNFVLLRESDELFSPLAMLHYSRYSIVEEVEDYIKKHTETIQVIVGKKFTPFGAAQSPTLSDYADNVDTMHWLNSLA